MRIVYTALMLLFLTGLGTAQSFTFTSDNLMPTGAAGTFFDIYADLTNTSNQELSIRIIRTRADLPPDPGWFNSLCNGLICYDPIVDTILVPDPFWGVPALGVDSTMEFHLNVGSDFTTPGTAFIDVRAENIADTSDNVQLSFVVSTSASSIGDDEQQLNGFVLNQNYPNPFNPVTTIEYNLPAVAAVTLEIFDVMGRRIVTPFSAALQTAGSHTWQWNGTDSHGNPVASGIYYYRLRSDGHVQIRKMLLTQ